MIRVGGLKAGTGTCRKWCPPAPAGGCGRGLDRKSTRLNSSHGYTSYAVFCLKKKKLASPRSAILSAVIFNALIIILLIPLALRAIKYRPLCAAALFRRSMLIHGLGVLIALLV